MDTYKTFDLNLNGENFELNINYKGEIPHFEIIAVVLNNLSSRKKETLIPREEIDSAPHRALLEVSQFTLLTKAGKTSLLINHPQVEIDVNSLLTRRENHLSLNITESGTSYLFSEGKLWTGIGHDMEAEKSLYSFSGISQPEIPASGSSLVPTKNQPRQQPKLCLIQ